MKPEEIQHLRNLRQAASTEAAFLNAELSLLGRSFNYNADLKLARCELDMVNCLIGLIDLRFAAYRGDKSLDGIVAKSESSAVREDVRAFEEMENRSGAARSMALRPRSPEKPDEVEVSEDKDEEDAEDAGDTKETQDSEKTDPTPPESPVDKYRPKKGLRAARPVLAMEMESGVIVEFPSITEAARAASPGGPLSSTSICKRVERMTPELWVRGPSAIMALDTRNRYTFKGWAFILKEDMEAADPEELLASAEDGKAGACDGEIDTGRPGEEIVGMELATGRERRFPSAVAAVKILYGERDAKKARNLSMSIRSMVRRASVHEWGNGPGYFLHDAPDNMRYRGWTFISAAELDEFRKGGE